MSKIVLSDVFEKFMKISETINKKLECDEDCEREKQLNELRNNYNKLKTTYTEIGNKQIRYYTEQKNFIIENINNFKNSLHSHNISIDNISRVIDFTDNENKRLKRDIDEIKSNINVNDRKFYYKKQHLKYKLYIKYFLSSLYTIFCLINLYYSNIITDFFNKKIYYIGKMFIMVIYFLLINNIFYYI